MHSRSELASGPLTLNMDELNGNAFEYEHIGNLGKWFEIQDASVQAIEAVVNDQ